MHKLPTYIGQRAGAGGGGWEEVSRWVACWFMLCSRSFCSYSPARRPHFFVPLAPRPQRHQGLRASLAMRRARVAWLISGLLRNAHDAHRHNLALLQDGNLLRFDIFVSVARRTGQSKNRRGSIGAGPVVDVRQLHAIYGTNLVAADVRIRSRRRCHPLLSVSYQQMAQCGMSSLAQSTCVGAGTAYTSS